MEVGAGYPITPTAGELTPASPSQMGSSSHPAAGAHLALAAQAPLLQTGPDALDPARMLRVVAVVTTGTLVFEHHRVINQPCKAQGELLPPDWTGLGGADPKSAHFRGWMRPKTIWFDWNLPQTMGASVPTCFK